MPKTKKRQSKQPYALQVRPSEEVRTKLKEAAQAAGRTLTKEMERRLEASLEEGRTYSARNPYAGWPAAEAHTFEAFGEIAGRLLADVTLAAGTKTPLQDRLGFMRAVLPVLLDELGASAPKAANESYFEGRTRAAITDARMKGYAASVGAEYAETDLARLVREIKSHMEN
jgi:hypothetical protein